MSFKRRAGSSPALGTEKASPKLGEAFLSRGRCPEQGKSGQHLISQSYQSITEYRNNTFSALRNQNNSYLCDIIFVKTTLLTKQGRYLFLNGYLPLSYRGAVLEQKRDKASDSWTNAVQKQTVSGHRKSLSETRGGLFVWRRCPPILSQESTYSTSSYFTVASS